MSATEGSAAAQTAMCKLPAQPSMLKDLFAALAYSVGALLVRVALVVVVTGSIWAVARATHLDKLHAYHVLAPIQWVGVIGVISVLSELLTERIPTIVRRVMAVHALYLFGVDLEKVNKERCERQRKHAKGLLRFTKP